MGRHNFYKSFWNIKIIRRGEEIWSIRKRNSLADQGEEAILETFFRLNASYTPSAFYIRLCNSVITETDTLDTITDEASGNGYSPQLVEASTVGFPTKDLYEGDYRLISKELTFTASGGSIGPVITAFLATASDANGILVSFLSLPITRTILDGDSMLVQFEVVLQ